MRKDIPEESGIFEYSYDAVGRLTGVSKDGVLKRSYTYDPFGNRDSLTDEQGRTEYKYDPMDRLLRASGVNNQTFNYDKRGNVIERFEDGKKTHSYVYGAADRLESAKSPEGSASYEYNSLGYRIGERIVSEDKTEQSIRYTQDFTKYYNNLVERSVNGSSTIIKNALLLLNF